MARTMKGLEKKDSSLMFREITPPHGWKEDSDFHYLRLTLPGFEAKDIRIHMDKYGHLVVRGNRQISEHKYMSFEETFDVPATAELEEAEGLFEDEQIYCITIPKKKDGHKSGHRISMQKDGDNNNNNNNPKGKDLKFGPIHKYNTTDKQEGLSHIPADHQRIPKNPLKMIEGDKGKKSIVFSIALLIALIIVMVVLIVKLHRR
ncbi:hypothetical protein ACS0TY_006898 [Phlomoides rotata]